MTTELLAGTQVWPEILRAAQSPGPRHVAVGYVTDLSWLGKPRQGDVLVVDASERAIAGGLTSPRALQPWISARGARVYSVEGLHAKVYVLGDRVVIGSANASVSSQKSLVEAVSVWDARGARETGISLVSSLVDTYCDNGMTGQLTKDWLPEATRRYDSRPVRGMPFRPSLAPTLLPPQRPLRVRFLEVSVEPRTHSEATAYKLAARVARRVAGPASLYTVEEMPLGRQWSGMEVGDVLLQAKKVGDDWWVTPPTTIVHMQSGSRGLRTAFLRSPRWEPVEMEEYGELSQLDMTTVPDGGLMPSRWNRRLLSPWREEFGDEWPWPGH
jgi:hypothetical protein